MRTRFARVLLAALVAATLAGVRAAPGQATPPAAAGQQPTFRGGASYVRVDMFAARDGRAVDDLRADEVEVLEDGVRQTVDVFEHVKVAAPVPQEFRVEPNSVSQSREMAANPRARVFVIFLDTYHTRIEGSARMTEPLARFVDRIVGPDDLVGLMTPEMSATDVTLGRKTTVVSNLLSKEWTWGRRGRLADDDPQEEAYEQCYAGEAGVAAELKARRREKLTLDALDDLVVHLTGLREERKAVLVITEGWLQYPPNPGLAATSNPRIPEPPDVFTRGTPRRGERTTPALGARAGCDADRVALSMMDHTQRLRDLVGGANRGNVSFYPVFARGLVTTDAPLGADSSRNLAEDAAHLRDRQNGLRYLAEDTDGLAVVNTNDTSGALRRIVDDMSSYYLLGYYSSNPKLDGRFRTISVRTTRAGTRLRARRGYRALTSSELARGVSSPAPPSAGPAAAGPDVAGGTADAPPSGAPGTTNVPASTMLNAFNAVASAGRQPFMVRTASWVAPATGTADAGTFWVVGELDYATRGQARWAAGGQVEVAVAAEDGRLVLSRTAALTPPDGSFVMRLPDTGGVPPGRYTVRVRLRADGGGGLGLNDIARVVVPDGPSALGEALLWRRGPSTGVRYVRTADPRFRRTERLRLELASAGGGAGVTARLLDRTGSPLDVPLPVSERVDDATAERWVLVDATLAPLPVGDYAVEITDGIVARLTAFRIVP